MILDVNNKLFLEVNREGRPMDFELKGYKIGNISLIESFKLQVIYKVYALYWLQEKHQIQMFTMGTYC